MRLLLDTCVVVDYLRGVDPGYHAVAFAMARHEAVTTTITEAELWSGIRDAADERDVRRALSGLAGVLRLDRQDARAAGTPLRILGPHHEADALIAGVALARGLSLLTRDALFRRVPGLRVIQP